MCDAIVCIYMQIYTDYSRLFAPKHTFPAMILDIKKSKGLGCRIARYESRMLTVEHMDVVTMIFTG